MIIIIVEIVSIRGKCHFYNFLLSYNDNFIFYLEKIILKKNTLCLSALHNVRNSSIKKQSNVYIFRMCQANY